MKWFFDCFGESKRDNPFPYLAISTRVITDFYLCLLDTGIFKGSKCQKRYSDAVKKMSKFIFTADWSRIGDAARYNMLVNHWNKKRQLYKIKYE
jgi:hypothetical protein